MSAHVSGVLENRLVVRCDNCRMTQFETRSGDCRKCGQPYEEPVNESAQPVNGSEGARIAGEPYEHPLQNSSPIDCGRAVRVLRKLLGWSQRELGLRSGHVRIHISKFENSKSRPTLESISKLSSGFGISERDFIALATLGNE